MWLRKINNINGGSFYVSMHFIYISHTKCTSLVLWAGFFFVFFFCCDIHVYLTVSCEWKTFALLLAIIEYLSPRKLILAKHGFVLIRELKFPRKKTLIQYTQSKLGCGRKGEKGDVILITTYWR